MLAVTICDENTLALAAENKEDCWKGTEALLGTADGSGLPGFKEKAGLQGGKINGVCSERGHEPVSPGK